ncbi:hypothetical protein [Streptomyces melanogenes]|uniref:hypothetical protein n=1 Tax=Streptomyces melanogenes TaxID=67326 RepID=UPI00379AEF22
MSSWRVYLEYDASGTSSELHEYVRAAIAGLDGAPTVAPNGNFAVYLSVEAMDCETALAGARHTANLGMRDAHRAARVVGMEVMTEREFRRRRSSPMETDVLDEASSRVAPRSVPDNRRPK